MQKKLIALAIASLASAPLVAQAADVTFSGLIDLGVAIQEEDTTGTTLKKTTAGIANGSGTSAFKVTITEDLGGGMKVTGYLETDPALGTESGAAFANAPNWIQLSGNFGAITLGYMNNYALSASSASQPYGTGLASGYNGTFGRLDGVNSIGTPSFSATGSANGVRDIRVRNSIQYDLPKMGGFTAGVIYKFQNDDFAGTVDGVGNMQFGASFTAGAFTIVGALSTFESASAAPFVGTSDSFTHTLIGANFKLGAFTIYGGYTMSEADNSADLDSKSYNVAAKFDLSPTFNIGVNVLEVDDANATDRDRDLIGIGADYSLSKRTALYFRYQSGDNNSASAVGDYSDMAVGIRHTF
jgi:predicted porin